MVALIFFIYCFICAQKEFTQTYLLDEVSPLNSTVDKRKTHFKLSLPVKPLWPVRHFFLNFKSVSLSI